MTNKTKTDNNFTEEINKCVTVLQEGGIIIYPTDTVWGIGCDATNEDAVNKIYQLKKRANTKTMICLVSNDFMLERHVEKVPEVAFDIIDIADKPTTIVYDNPKGVAKNLVAEDNSLAIRVATDKFCQYLIQKFKKPIVSTSANLAGEPTAKSFKEISKEILKGVDYAVNLQRNEQKDTPSSIIKLGNDGTVKVIRK
ncbi:L-threonylcarbamoyladenylate synthase [Cellulophaga fucicola]|uniref:L-threonylcarbamoyladenylate synthase n=1 Tax=Cellulophaga fucicola TaxID=76595 RepID=UPI003EB73069